MPATFDVIIVGGGAVGAACARELALAGHKVLIVDRGMPDGEAWRASAGMLAPQIEAQPEDPLFDLGLAGRERYTMLAPQLLESTGVDIGLWQGGIAHLAMDEASAAALRLSVSMQRQQGHLCDWLDAAEVRAQWPWLGPSSGALWASREAAVDPVRLVEALLADAKAHGSVVAIDQVNRLEQSNGRVTGVRGREFYAAPNVVIAAGAWSGTIEGLPRPVAIEPVRGQMAALAWPMGVPPAIIYNRDCYLVHRDGEALIGSTMEYVGFDTGTTREGIARIVKAVSALYPPFATQPIRRSWSGLRPVSPDGRPIVGAEPRLPGLWYATGHGRNGILLAGITGVVMRELVGREESREDIDALRPDRFWRW